MVPWQFSKKVKQPLYFNNRNRGAIAMRIEKGFWLFPRLKLIQNPESMTLIEFGLMTCPIDFLFFQFFKREFLKRRRVMRSSVGG